MTKIAQSISQLVGNTPLLKLNNFCAKRELYGNILAKLEYYNPASSVKDRIALGLINDAEEKGLIKEGATIIEPTSGNTGIGLAWVCAIKNYRLILTMPETMSIERIKLVKQYGAEVILTQGALGMQGAVDKALELKDSIANSFIPQQFENKVSIKVHRQTTAKEILECTDNNVSFFVAGVGTGGTLTGVGQVLKEELSDIKVVAVEPFDSPLLSKGYAKGHGIMGIGANFVPKILDVTIINEIVTVTLDDAINTAKALATEEGILVGISSGAACYAAQQIAKRPETKGKNIVVILPDTGERYISTKLF
ncbi:MAG: cysteine synthase A [Clostridiales bacterium]|nr:cysteine synthase A [Clostridiales bacterium]